MYRVVSSYAAAAPLSFLVRSLFRPQRRHRVHVRYSRAVLGRRQLHCWRRRRGLVALWRVASSPLAAAAARFVRLAPEMRFERLVALRTSSRSIEGRAGLSLLGKHFSSPLSLFDNHP